MLFCFISTCWVCSLFKWLHRHDLRYLWGCCLPSPLLLIRSKPWNTGFHLFSFKTLFQLYRDIIDISHCVSFRYTVCWPDTLTQCKMITNILWVSTPITSHNYHFFLVWRTFQTFSLPAFQVYNTLLLTTIPRLCIRPPELRRLLMEVCTFTFFNVITPWWKGEKQTGDELESWFLKESNRTFLSTISVGRFYSSICILSQHLTNLS